MKKGIDYYHDGEYKEALEVFLSIEEKPFENPELSYFLGLCYTKLKNFDEALIYLEQVVTTHTNLLRIYQSRLILAYIYAVTGRMRLAEFELNRLQEEGFESVQLFATYGYVYYEMGKIDDSLSAIQKALALEPDNPNSLNSAGYIMAEEDMDIQSALNYCRTAVKLKPENPAYLDSLGWACYKAGALDEAVYYLNKALLLTDGNEVIESHLAEAEKGRRRGKRNG